MNEGFMKNVIRFVAAGASLLTMIFSPLALGLQSEDTLKKQIEAFISETQLNKRITYKEFWNKTKHLYSGQVYKDVERYLMSAPNELMPEFTLKESVSSTGEKIPTLTISEKGKSYNMQIFGEKAKFAKLNNVVLTENDLMLITPAMKRLMASDIKIKKEHDKNLIKVKPSTFTGTPKITREMWKKMTSTQRAQFMIGLRLLHSGAEDVLNAKEAYESKNVNPKKGKKTSALDKWNNFFAMLNQDTEAVAAGTKCVVAGYIGTYGADRKCKYPAGAISPGCNLPCNPTIYGFGGGGKQFCLSNDTELQTATHYNKGCDAKMPLTSIELSLPRLASAKKDASRYQGILDENRAEALKDPKVIDNTRTYLASMLQGTPDLKAAFESGNISEELLAKLREIQTQFDSTIAAARKDCSDSADEKAQYDKNFWGACDQLHKRFLFVAEVLTKKPGCPENKSVNPETLKCPCDGGGEAIPGAQCVAVVAPVTEPTESGSGTTEVVGGSETLQCTGETVEKDGSCVCENGKEPQGEDKKCGSGFNWKPWLIGAGVIAGGALLWFLLKKKKKDKPELVPPVVPPPQGCQTVCAANMTQNPTTCACDPIVQQPTCVAPQVLNAGVCSCPTANACTPGQQVYNLSSCQCDTVVQPGTCPDGTTTYYTPPGPSTCPAPTICQNGSSVYPPATCPPVTEGGNGDNCPSGDCNGGVPTAN